VFYRAWCFIARGVLSRVVFYRAWCFMRFPFVDSVKFARLFGGAVFIFGFIPYNIAGSQPPGTYYPLYGNCTVNTPNIDYTIGNIANIHSVYLNFSVSCDNVTPTVKAGNPAAPWYADKSITDPVVVYCWHMHGTAAAGTAPLRTTDPGPAQAADPAKGIPYIAPRTISFRYYSDSMGVSDDPGDAGYVGVGSAGGINRYNITGMAVFANTCDKQTYCSHVQWNSRVEMRFEGNDTSAPFPTGDYKYPSLQYHATYNVIQRGAMPNYLQACRNATGSDIGGEVSGKADFFRIHVETYCHINGVSDIEFGKQMSLHETLKARGSVNASCSAGTTYNLSFSDGNNYVNGQRHMRRVPDADSDDGDSMVAYNITLPPQCQGNVCTGAGNGIEPGTPYEVDAEVPPQPTPRAGTYRDTIVITLDQTTAF